MSVYIAYRDLPRYFNDQNQMGGTPFNSDIRLMTSEAGAYLLTYSGQDYAVSNERGEKFTEEVLAKCTDKHRGFFPLKPSYNGRNIAAVIEIHKDRDFAYYDMDAEELLQMLTALRDESGEPLDRKGVINHCYPNPALPEGDFFLQGIYHQKFIPDKNSPSVIQSFTYDKVTSDFWVYDGEAHIEVREDNTKNTYDVPAELIPEIKEKVRQLCEDPAEAYVEDGAFEAFVNFGENGEKKIFTKPDKTLALLKEIASKCVFKGSEEVKGLSFYGGEASRSAFCGMFSKIPPDMQTAVLVSQEAKAVREAAGPDPEPADPDRCLYCGAPRNGHRFCTECGGEFK